MEVDFPSLVLDPLVWMPRLREFLGESFTGDDAALAEIAKPQLFRNRDVVGAPS